VADHALATVSNPSSALTDFTLIVDLSNMPANWWSAVDTSDGTRGRVYKGDGTTRLACDWIDFDDVNETGLLRVLWSGTLASTGTQQLWIEPPVSTNASVSASDTYGSDNAYDANWLGYYPSGGGADRTSNGNDGTGAGGVTAGDSSGIVGSATSYDGTDDRTELPVGIFDSASAGTICAWFNTDDASTAQSIYTGGDFRNRLYLNLNSSGYLYARVGDETEWTTGTPVSTSTWYHGSLYWSSGSQSLSIDAASPSSQSYSGSWGNIEAEAIGAYEDRGGVANTIFDGLISEVHLHSVSRGADWISHEYDQTNDNATFWGTWSWETGGGGTTLSLGTLQSSHVLDAVTIQQIYNIAIGDAEHAHAIAGVDLSGLATDITIVGGQHAQTLDAIGLTQIHNIALGELGHTHTLDEIAVTESGVLAVADLLHGHTLSGVSLTQLHNITVGELLHSQAIDGVSTSARIEVVVPDLSHGHTVDGVALTSAQVLAIDDAGHAHTLGSIELTQRHLITLQDLTHSQGLDAISFGLAVGEVTITFAAKQPGIGFASKQPGMSFSAKQPNITWSN
jgi:hypothetical protein